MEKLEQQFQDSLLPEDADIEILEDGDADTVEKDPKPGYKHGPPDLQGTVGTIH